MAVCDAAPLALLCDQLREWPGVTSVERIRGSSELVDHTTRDHATRSSGFDRRSLAFRWLGCVLTEPAGEQVAASVRPELLAERCLPARTLIDASAPLSQIAQESREQRGALMEQSGRKQARSVANPLATKTAQTSRNRGPRLPIVARTTKW